MAGFSWGWLIGLIALVLKPLLKAMTPSIEGEMEKALINVYKRALETPNPIDDLAMKFILDIVDIDIPE